MHSFRFRFTVIALLALVGISSRALAAPEDLDSVQPKHDSPLALKLLPESTSPIYAAAEMPKFDDDQWHLMLAFPLWIPGVSGDVTVRGRTFKPDQDTSDSIDVIDNHINFAFVG